MYVCNGFHVFDFIAHCWATFSTLRALLSSHIMTNKDDDDDDEFFDAILVDPFTETSKFQRSLKLGVVILPNFI